ncbi:MAG: hypothetical protein CMN72_03560 [Sphingomonas sp.]|nr:hypothetical protein [Sphingomonas sp.]
MFGTAAELGLLVSSTMPALDEDEQMGLAFAPQAFLRMPPVAAKELMVLLGNYIKQVENDVGELKSEFLASQASSD